MNSCDLSHTVAYYSGVSKGGCDRKQNSHNIVNLLRRNGEREHGIRRGYSKDPHPGRAEQVCARERRGCWDCSPSLESIYISRPALPDLATRICDILGSVSVCASTRGTAKNPSARFTMSKAKSLVRH